jgi:NAD-dependent deacetylase
MPTLIESYQQRISSAVEILQNSKFAVVLSGAGISTPSGIQDFRSTKSGLWQRYDPSEVASLIAFRYHPEKLFNWMRPLANDIIQAKPNRAHQAIADLQRKSFIHTVITQNIDGLHQKAGSQDVIEVHGSLNTMSCISCFLEVGSSGYLERYVEQGLIPQCPHCHAILKPNIILFGEQLPATAWNQANNLSRRCDLMIVVGSSLEVLPVASLPMLALDHGARLIIINNSQTYLDIRADVVFPEDVALVLPDIKQQIYNS